MTKPLGFTAPAPPCPYCRHSQTWQEAKHEGDLTYCINCGTRIAYSMPLGHPDKADWDTTHICFDWKLWVRLCDALRTMPDNQPEDVVTEAERLAKRLWKTN